MFLSAHTTGRTSTTWCTTLRSSSCLSLSLSPPTQRSTFFSPGMCYLSTMIGFDFAFCRRSRRLLVGNDMADNCSTAMSTRVAWHFCFHTFYTFTIFHDHDYHDGHDDLKIFLGRGFSPLGTREIFRSSGNVFPNTTFLLADTICLGHIIDESRGKTKSDR